MKVYLFSDYLKTIHGEPLSKDQEICELDTIDSLPDCIVKLKGKLARVCCLNRGEDRVYIEYMPSIPKKKEISHAEYITCPHCGTENHDSWEAIDSDEKRHCDVCGSVFSYKRYVEVTYSSIIIERNDKVLLLG